MQKNKETPIESHELSTSGLTTKLALARLKVEGFNELPTKNRRDFLRIFLDVIREPMFALLVGGGVVYLLLGDRIDAIFLLVFACLSVSITIVQESRSEHVLDALRKLASPRAFVLRDGKQQTIAGREVVRGDFLIIAEGERISADAKLISAQDLLVDESQLTGESVPVAKSMNVKNQHEMMLFAGSLVVRGSGTALVEAIGLKTEMGKIGGALSSIETEQPHLQKQIKHLVRNFAIIGSLAGLVAVALYGFLRGSWLEAMLSGIALGMSLLPQEFPLVMAVFMAMGAWRISQARVLTRRASAIESLGATTVLCTDKTGTLTKNKMTVVAIVSQTEDWQISSNSLFGIQTQVLLEAALYACQSPATDPMDIAIQTLAKTKIIDTYQERTRLAPLHAYGLRPDCFAVGNAFKQSSATTLFIKGALEAILPICTLSKDEKSKIHGQAETLAKQGIRVLAVARSVISEASKESFPSSLKDFSCEYLGLIGLADPLRNNVPQAIQECHTAGIKVLMITGDYPVTARAIAHQAGIKADEVITGDEIEKMSDQALVNALTTSCVFARIKPNQKLRLVQILKKKGEIVAMTGDGVNDAPAIKAANIGISMGGRGTDVAREASSIVLLDDDFSAIVKTIRLGRRIYDNLRKAIEYIIAVHIPIAGLAILPLIFGIPLILTPIHIAFLEMLIDPACSIVFEAESEESNVMSRTPRNTKEPLVLRKRVLWAIAQGSTVLLILAMMLAWATLLKMPEDAIRTFLFTSLVMMNVGLILVNRTFSASLMRAIFKPNRALLILISLVFLVLAITVFWQPARVVFHFGEFNWQLFTVSLVASFGLLILLEGIKMVWFDLNKKVKKTG